MPETPPASSEIPPEPAANLDEFEQQLAEAADADYGPPFEKKSFGGQFVWARGEHYESKILRVRAGQKVIISTTGRKDMVALLTGGRGVIEVIDEEGSERSELMPGEPIMIEAGRDYRLVAMTEIELFTVHSPED